MGSSDQHWFTAEQPKHDHALTEPYNNGRDKGNGNPHENGNIPVTDLQCIYKLRRPYWY